MDRIIKRVKELRFRLNKKKRKDLFRKDDAIKLIAEKYMDKARHNLVCMQTDYNLSVNSGLKTSAKLSPDFNEYDWIVIKGYYAMYHSALACLAKLGFKSTDHVATILALELFFVHKGLLEKKYLEMLKKARKIEEDYVSKIVITKRARRIAQYDVGEETEKFVAEQTLKSAKEFVNRLDKLFDEIKEVEDGK